MTKAQWQQHAREAGEHDRANCPECRARAKTRRANARARERDQVMRDCGLVKVRGALGGIYWE